MTRRAKRRLVTVAVVVVLVVLAAVVQRVVRARAYIWLPDYARHLVASKPRVDGTQHVLFLFVDHYEPGRGEQGVARNREWLASYREFADRHRDSYGRKPQHTWFYAYDHLNDGAMTDLSRAVYDGYGEVELHWHHGGDTNQDFPAKLAAALAWFRAHGALVSEDGKTSFGFIHGNWTLDNSGKPERCGVSRELTFLKEAGCYADFTFPAAASTAQPSKVNSIYYALDDDRPKSYDDGVDAEVGRRNADGFLIFTGPIGLKAGMHFTDAGALELKHGPALERVDRWVNTAISVKGRPEWIFVKIYTHGVQGRSVVFSPGTDAMFSHLEESYGTGNWRLHYVTAREAYNIVRAAEDGLTGDPDVYRDYEIKRPLNSLRPLE